MSCKSCKCSISEEIKPSCIVRQPDRTEVTISLPPDVLEFYKTKHPFQDVRDTIRNMLVDHAEAYLENAD